MSENLCQSWKKSLQTQPEQYYFPNFPERLKKELYDDSLKEKVENFVDNNLDKKETNKKDIFDTLIENAETNEKTLANDTEYNNLTSDTEKIKYWTNLYFLNLDQEQDTYSNEQCFKVFLADRNFPNYCRPYLQGSMLSRRLFKQNNKELENKQNDEIEEIIKKNTGKIIDSFFEQLEISKEKRYKYKYGKIKQLTEYSWNNYSSELKTFLKEVAQKEGKNGFFEVSFEEGKPFLFIQTEDIKQEDLTSSLIKIFTAAISLYKEGDELDLMLLEKEIKVDKYLKENAIKFLNTKTATDILNKAFYVQGSYSGVNGFIGEVLGLFNFQDFSHTGPKEDVLEYKGITKRLGESASDLTKDKEGVNIKHYISTNNEQIQSFYKADSVSLYQQNIFRYMSVQDVLFLRFLYSNHQIFSKIYNEELISEEDFKDQVLKKSIKQIDTFARVSSAATGVRNTFFMINNVIIPTSIILKKMRDHQEVTIKNNPITFPDPVTKKDGPDENLLINKTHKNPIIICYQDLKIKMSDFKI